MSKKCFDCGKEKIRVGVVFGKFPSGDFVLEPCNLEDCGTCCKHIFITKWEEENV